MSQIFWTTEIRIYIYPARQSRVQSSLQSTPWYGPVVDTCTICTSGPSSSREPASGSARQVGPRALEAETAPKEKKHAASEKEKTTHFSVQNS